MAAINERIQNEKFQYDLKREAAKIYVLSSGNIDKPPKQTEMIEYVKFTYRLFAKAFEKQVKTIKQRIKQIKF